jgi:hypothetical protein
MEEITLNAKITIIGTKNKRSALRAIQMMIDDYADNNKGMGNYYKEIEIEIV